VERIIQKRIGLVRIDDLGNGRRGVAVAMLMSVYLGGEEILR
jgi:hypothetical protein